jgi:hypothetical protein
MASKLNTPQNAAVFASFGIAETSPLDGSVIIGVFSKVDFASQNQINKCGGIREFCVPLCGTREYFLLEIE